MSENNKNRLFEIIGKIDPDFKQSLNEAENPCWKGHRQYGMKEKNGKQVPNCVPIDEQPNNPNAETGIPSDVNNLQKSIEAAPAVKYTLSRIDTALEFESAIKTIVGFMGTTPKKAITISQAQAMLKNAMQNLGYR